MTKPAYELAFATHWSSVNLLSKLDSLAREESKHNSNIGTKEEEENLNTLATQAREADPPQAQEFEDKRHAKENANTEIAEEDNKKAEASQLELELERQ